jgi:hypothetical protein
MNDFIKLKVGGKPYETSYATLVSDQDSMLACMFSGRHIMKHDTDGYYNIDRDPDYFAYIIKFLRDKKVNMDDFSISKIKDIRDEAEYFQIKGLIDLCDNKLKSVIKYNFTSQTEILETLTKLYKVPITIEIINKINELFNKKFTLEYLSKEKRTLYCDSELGPYYKMNILGTEMTHDHTGTRLCNHSDSARIHINDHTLFYEFYNDCIKHNASINRLTIQSLLHFLFCYNNHHSQIFNTVFRKIYFEDIYYMPEVYWHRGMDFYGKLYLYI